MRKIGLLILFLGIYLTISGTTKTFLDSVQNSLKTSTNPIAKLNSLYTLSFEYGFINPKKGLEFGKECLRLAVKENNLLYQLNAYNGMANAHETMSNFDSAKYYHTKSFDVAKKMGSPQKMALTLFNIGLCYKQLGDYRKALNQYLTAYKLLERETSYNPRVHFYIGEIYLRLGDYQQAEHHSRLGIKKCKEFGQEYINYNLYINLAKCLQHNGNQDSAIVLLNTALTELKKHTDKISIGICYNALGEIYNSKKDYKKAFDYFSEELLIQKEIKNDNGIYVAYLNLANTAAYMNVKDAALILNFLKQSEERLPFIKRNNDILLESYYKMAKIYELINRPQTALLYYKQFFALKDSLLNKEKLYQLSELQTKYGTEKKEQQIVSLKQNDLIKSLEIKRKNIFIVFGGCLFVLIGFLIYFFLQKQKLKTAYEKELAIKITEEKERLRLAKDIHDDLGSGLSKINFLSELVIRNKNLSDEATTNVEAIAETSKKLVANMRDLIWALNYENTNLEGLLSRIREYSSDYLEDFSSELKLSFPNKINNTPILKESYREILMTIKECLNNIVKHSKANQVEIESQINNGQLYISIKDNGVGISSGNKIGNGLKNMRARIEALGGLFNLESTENQGTLIMVTVPIENISVV